MSWSTGPKDIPHHYILMVAMNQQILEVLWSAEMLGHIYLRSGQLVKSTNTYATHSFHPATSHWNLWWISQFVLSDPSLGVKRSTLLFFKVLSKPFCIVYLLYPLSWNLEDKCRTLKKKKKLSVEHILCALVNCLVGILFVGAGWDELACNSELTLVFFQYISVCKYLSILENVNV